MNSPVVELNVVPPPIDVARELTPAAVVERLPYALPAAIYFLKNNLVFYGCVGGAPAARP